MCPVDIASCAGEPRARVERAVRADRVRVRLVHVARAVVARRRGVGKPWRFVSSRRNVIWSSSEVARVAGDAARPRRPTSCRCRSSGFFAVAPTGISGMMPLARRRRRADDRLEVHLHELVGEVLRAQELEQRRIAVRPTLSSKLPPIAIRQRPATCRMFSTMRSKVPWPPRSGRIRLCVSRSPSSVILMPLQAERQHPVDHVRRQQQAVGDDVDERSHAARLRRRATPLGQRRTSPAGSAAARRRRTSARTSRAGRDPARARSSRRRAPPSRATSCRRTCCSRRDRPGSSSRRRSCTAASSAP